MVFLRCKLLNYIDIRTATNSSKAQVARSNRAGQAKFHIGSYKSRLEDFGLLTESWICLTSVGEALDPALRILANYGQLGE